MTPTCVTYNWRPTINHAGGQTKNKLKTTVKSMKYIFEFQWKNELKRMTSRTKGGGGGGGRGGRGGGGGRE